MIPSLLILALGFAPVAPMAPVQDPPASAWPAGSVFDEPGTAEAPAETPARTTPEAADHACRGQLYRRPNETRAACVARLVETDALSAALPRGNPPRQSQCRRESRRSEDGQSFGVSFICEERTVTTTPE